MLIVSTISQFPLAFPKSHSVLTFSPHSNNDPTHSLVSLPRATRARDRSSLPPRPTNTSHPSFQGTTIPIATFIFSFVIEQHQKKSRQSCRGHLRGVKEKKATSADRVSYREGFGDGKSCCGADVNLCTHTATMELEFFFHSLFYVVHQLLVIVIYMHVFGLSLLKYLRLVVRLISPVILCHQTPFVTYPVRRRPAPLRYVIKTVPYCSLLSLHSVQPPCNPQRSALAGESSGAALLPEGGGRFRSARLCRNTPPSLCL
jgi:hypothetical protein